MSPSIDPVVCRATSKPSRSSSGGLIVLHQASKPPKATAKTRERDQGFGRLRRMNSAAIVARPRSAVNTIAAAALKASGAPGSRNHSASALHAVSGAMTTIAAMIHEGDAPQPSAA